MKKFLLFFKIVAHIPQEIRPFFNEEESFSCKEKNPRNHKGRLTQAFLDQSSTSKVTSQHTISCEALPYFAMKVIFHHRVFAFQCLYTAGINKISIQMHIIILMEYYTCKKNQNRFRTNHWANCFKNITFTPAATAEQKKSSVKSIAYSIRKHFAVSAVKQVQMVSSKYLL